jgi:hypothetical protein
LLKSILTGVTRSPIPEIVEAIADAEGVDSENLDITLEEHISSEAIRLLADHEGGSWTLSFKLPDHKVTVTSDGIILVDGAKQEVWGRN